MGESRGPTARRSALRRRPLRRVFPSRTIADSEWKRVGLVFNSVYVWERGGKGV
jgi:hypothetical protein